METLLAEDRDIEVEVTFLTTEEGGRSKPAFRGYRPQFFYDGRDWDARYDFYDVELVMPGQSARAYVSFLSPECHLGRLLPSKEFLLREGQRVVAKGRVMRIMELKTSAEQSGRDASDCW
jgi:translation elongation factor EF-Tu-like GTPase